MSASNRKVLRRVGVFAGLDDEDCDAVLRVLTARLGAPGDILVREGEMGESLMIVLEGLLVAHVRTKMGTEEEVARLGPGEVVGEMAFLDSEPRSATVSAPNGAKVLDFTRAALATLRRDAPRVAAAIQKNLLLDVARRLRDVGNKITQTPATRPAESTPDSLRRPGRGLTAAQLRTVPSLASYTPDDLDLLAHIALLRSFAAGAMIMHEGRTGDACWLLVAGSVSVMRAGQVAPLATLGPGALVGQLALIDSAPRSASVMATVDTTALEVRADAFANLLRAHSPVALRFQEQVAMAGVRQLRAATRMYAEALAARTAATFGSVRMVRDWHEGDGVAIALSVDPKRLRR